jgi:hypothetical protein
LFFKTDELLRVSSHTLRVAGATAARSNIVFVLTEDHRWNAAGLASGGAVWSPGMDKLPSRAMLFSRA